MAISELTSRSEKGSRLFVHPGMHPLMAAMLTSSIAFMVYLATLAPDITWAYHGADGAELITAAVTLGVPHPPGYPLYVVLGKLASWLPTGTVAFRFNLLSALCMSLSAGLLAGAVARQLQFGANGAASDEARDHASPDYAGLSTAIFAGTCFAFLPLVWQQALIAEVYALNMLTVSVLLYLMLAPPSSRSSLRIGFALGLAVITHLTSSLLLVPALLAVGFREWKRFTLGAMIGLTPFLLLPFLATNEGPLVWGAPESLDGWWWLVSASIYRPNVLSFPVASWAERFSAWISEPTLLVVGVLLVYVLYRREALSKRLGSRHVHLALFATICAYLSYAFGYDSPDSFVFILPALGLACMLAAVAFEPHGRWALLLPLALLVINFQQIDLSKRTEARPLAESALGEFPRDAIILTSGDRATFSVWYFQHVEGQRSDVIVVDQDLLAFDWYRARLARANPSLTGLETDDLARFRRLNGRVRSLCELRLGTAGVAHFSCLGPLVGA